MVEVRPHHVLLHAPGVLRPLAGVLGLERDFHTSSVRMSTDRIGVLGTPLFAREYVVLTVFKKDRPAYQLALRPTDRDIARLQGALLQAGVVAESDE